MREVQYNGRTYCLDIVHSGQYHPYGDTYRVVHIKTDDDDAANILVVVHDAYGYCVPLEQFCNKDRIDDYFRGWCNVTKCDDGFMYTKVEPYTD